RPEILAEWAGVEPGSRAPAGVSLGVMPIEQTLAEVARFVEKGYRRVKLKIRPGDDVERVRAVREAHPDLMLMADANRGYGVADVGVFRALDEFDLVCVEEPVGGGIEALAAFQALISTPVCVDESIRDARDLDAVLASPNLRNVNLKIGKYGGVLPSLLAYRRCLEAEAQVWLGGMYETGVSKYLHAQFETLPGFTIPGDISETQRYFERDIVIPPVTVRDGDVVLPEGPGLGFEPDFERIGELLIDTIEMRRHGD
ncbi:MAG: o-succinylbenzoate synthase, partial [Actinobacteria bacterium]